MEKEVTESYIQENMPRKSFLRKRFVLRERRPYEIFWDEILIAILIVVMLLAVFINSMTNPSYVPPEPKAEDIEEIDIGVGVEEGLSAYASPQIVFPALHNL